MNTMKCMTSNVNRVGSDVFELIKDLHILKPFRGKSSGQRKSKLIPNSGETILQKHDPYSIDCQNDIPVRVTQRVDIHNVIKSYSTVNIKSLKVIDTCKSTLLKSDGLSLSLLNARSINNKATTICEQIIEKKTDMLAITETWLKSNNESVTNDLCPEGYSFIGAARKSARACRGGGVGLIYKSEYDIQTIPSDKFKSFEHLNILLKASVPMCLSIVYRPPPSKKNKLTITEFLEEFELFLSDLVVSHRNLFIVGDFNIHWGIDTNVNAKRFEDILQSFGLQQNVKSATHKSKNILDLVITPANNSLLKSVSVQNEDISDHYTVKCDLDFNVKQVAVKTKSVRLFKAIDRTAFGIDLKTMLTNVSLGENDNPNVILHKLNDTLSVVLDKHAPRKTVKVKGYTKKPWYNCEIHQERKVRRQMERKMLKSKLEIHKQIFLAQRNKVVKMIDSAKSEYYREKFSEADSKETFRLVNGLLQGKQTVNLPPYNDPKQMANDFVQYFYSKIETIQESFTPEHCVDISDPNSLGLDDSSCMYCFQLVTADSMRKVVMKSATKSCSQDAIPTWLLKEEDILSCLLPVITALVNASLQQGCFPDDMKHAIIIPLLKKLSLLLSLLKNFRPVSNLLYLGKVLEKVAANQLVEFLQMGGHFDPLQSAYRQGHGVETALSKIKNDIDQDLNLGYGILLGLLDLSAAFDTLDHARLLNQLYTIGVRGVALHWFRSYLTGRTQAVVIDGVSSDPVSLSTGVPQGSVLGPLLFLIYIEPLGRIIDKHGISRHGYADDTQLYVKFSLREHDGLQKATTKLENCISEIRHWLNHNKLKLNDSKTEFMVIAPPKPLQNLLAKNPQLTVGTSDIQPSSTVRNLGATFDSTMSMVSHVNNATRGIYFQLQRIKSIRCHLSIDTAAKLINALVTSRLDFNNGLLVGLPEKTTSRLQLAQNNAARVLTGASRRDHITPHLEALHWLPVCQRIKFKTLTMIHKAIHSDTAPSYLKDLVSPYTQTRTLRSSSDTSKLIVDKVKNSYGQRVMSSTGATWWNNLPLSLRSSSHQKFKKELKTVLFKEYFYR